MNASVSGTKITRCPECGRVAIAEIGVASIGTGSEIDGDVCVVVNDTAETRWKLYVHDPESKPTTDLEIDHSRVCDRCGAETYAWERCHICGHAHWTEGSR